MESNLNCWIVISKIRTDYTASSTNAISSAFVVHYVREGKAYPRKSTVCSLDFSSFVSLFVSLFSQSIKQINLSISPFWVVVKVWYLVSLSISTGIIIGEVNYNYLELHNFHTSALSTLTDTFSTSNQKYIPCLLYYNL